MASKMGDFSIGWMLISYFMIAGGFMIAGLIVAMAQIQSSSEIVGWVLLFFGGAFGGFFAGRASPGKTIIEPAVGGALLFASFFLMALLVPAFRQLLSGGSVAKAILLVGGTVGGGGLIGAVLGERTNAPQTDSGWRWTGFSTLVTLGAMFVIAMLGALLLMRGVEAGGQAEAPGNSAAFGFMVLAGAALLGGILTQAAAPVRMIGPASAGILVVVASVVVLMLVLAPGGSRPAVGELFLGLGVVGLGGMGVAAAGAAITWAIVKDRKQAGVSRLEGVFD